MFELGHIQGTSPTTFAPDGTFTRAEAVMLLWNLVGQPGGHPPAPFLDVAPGRWYAAAVAWAAETGVVLGYLDGTFAPNDPITRQQLFQLLRHFAEVVHGIIPTVPIPGEGWPFPAHHLIHAWAAASTMWLHARGLIEGDAYGNANPLSAANRAEAATLLMRFVELLTNPLVCPGCGDERTFWMPGDGENFEDNSVIVILTRCASRADNRDWTADDFDAIEGALYVRDLIRLSDKQYSYFRRVWDAEDSAYALNTPEAWQAFEIAVREAEEAYPFVNWRQFRRFMLIRLDQYCKENVRRVIYQLYQQHEFIGWVGPNDIDEPD